MKRISNRKHFNRCREFDGGTVSRYLEDLMIRFHPYQAAIILAIAADIFFSTLGFIFLIWVVTQ